MTTALPSGWALVPLKDVLAHPLANGRSVPDRTGGFPVLRLNALESGGVNLGIAKEGDWTAEEAAPFLVQAGDFLVARGNGSLDKVGRGARVPKAPRPVAFPDTMIRIRLNPKAVDPLYFEHLWQAHAIRTQVRAIARTTAGIYKVNQRGLEGIMLPLPPVAEQRRVAAALTNRLDPLEIAEVSLRRVGRLLRTMRHRVLIDAITPGARQSPNRDTWTTYSLDDVARSVKNGMFVSRPGNVPSGVPILRIGSVRPLALNLQDRRWTGLEPDHSAVEGFHLRQDDLLFTRYNGNPDFVGACAVVPRLAEALVYPDKLIRVRLDQAKADPLFVAMACSVGDTRAAIASNIKTTSGQTGISGRDLRAVTLNLPALPEQRARATNAAVVLADLERLEQQFADMERRMSALRLSLLAAASAGRLVPQDPTDESASAMIERIREASKATDMRGPGGTVGRARKSTKQESIA